MLHLNKVSIIRFVYYYARNSQYTTKHERTKKQTSRKQDILTDKIETQLNLSLLKDGRHMAKRDTVNKNKLNE